MKKLYKPQSIGNDSTTDMYRKVLLFNSKVHPGSNVHSNNTRCLSTYLLHGTNAFFVTIWFYVYSKP